MSDSQRVADATELLARWRQGVERRLLELLDDLGHGEDCPADLLAALRQALGGGKRLRPLLLLASHRACAGRPAGEIDAACAVEMIHAYSLIHDDLPALDDDDFRRGQPSLHKQHGEALAILAGDALQAWAFETLAAAVPSQRSGRAVGLLAGAAGPRGMVGGQADDIRPWPRAPAVDVSESIARRKTGRLMGAACGLGSLLAGAPSRLVDEYEDFGARLGLAFQIVDDLLAWHGREKTLGRPAEADQRHRRPTHPRCSGAAASATRVKTLLEELQRDLSGLTNGDGTAVEAIIALVQRRLPN